MLCYIEVGNKIEHTVYEYDFGTVHLTTYFCDIVERVPVLTEHAQMKWLEPYELPTLEWAPADKPTINELVNIDLSEV